MRLAPWRRRFEPDHLVVVTFGRSGSTLVQGLLNALPGTLVRGENGFFPIELFRARQRAVGFAERHARHGSAKSSSAFFGVRALRAESFARHSRALMHEVLLGARHPREARRLGFKEVLWHEVAPEETEEFFAWLEEVLPGVRYVLNTRDPEAAIGSGFWQRQDRTDAIAAMERVLEIQDFLRRTRPDRVVDTRFEAITSDDATVRDEALRRLAEFVTGRCDEVTLARLRDVLAVGHGPKPFGASRTAEGGE